MNLTVLQDSSEQIHYLDPAIPLYVRRGNLGSMTNMAALCHWHEDVELLLALKGHLNYSINGTHVEIPEGSAIFVNSRQMHFGYSADGTDCDYVCVTFRPELLCANETLSRRFILPLVSACTPYALLEAGRDNSLLMAIHQLDTLYQQKTEGFELLAIARVMELWQGLYARMKGQIDASADNSAEISIVRQMLEHIRTNYTGTVTLTSIAGAAGVCRTRCCQIFKRNLGMTPNDYLNSLRLEKSMELLRGTTLSITEVASACGYASSSYFTERFTREKGCTPTQYRKGTPRGAKNHSNSSEMGAKE